MHVSNAPCWILQKLTWRSGQADREMCAVKGKHRVCIKNRPPRTFCSTLLHTERDINHQRKKKSWLLLNKLLCVVCSQDECHNFIKVLVPRNDDLVFICGTNGFNPMCRYYRVGIQGPILRYAHNWAAMQISSEFFINEGDTVCAPVMCG